MAADFVPVVAIKPVTLEKPPLPTTGSAAALKSRTGIGSDEGSGAAGAVGHDEHASAVNAASIPKIG